ncbi:hypothetical protein [Amycolatopsis sp. NPDC051061]|uniref:hypothetical protein n=1 Tax=Amycolatopsis sp. NPDC051061 TaxID=3155042 RepID=UPI0034405261
MPEIGLQGNEDLFIDCRRGERQFSDGSTYIHGGRPVFEQRQRRGDIETSVEG